MEVLGMSPHISNFEQINKFWELSHYRTPTIHNLLLLINLQLLIVVLSQSGCVSGWRRRSCTPSSSMPDTRPGRITAVVHARLAPMAQQRVSGRLEGQVGPVLRVSSSLTNEG